MVREPNDTGQASCFTATGRLFRLLSCAHSPSEEFLSGIPRRELGPSRPDWS